MLEAAVQPTKGSGGPLLDMHKFFDKDHGDDL